jgi:hypothetical protein
MLACTAITAVTPPADVTADDARANRWLLHFIDREPVAVTFSPAVTHADAIDRCPGAVAAEPMPEASPGALPADVAGRIDECVAADLYGDEDRELLARMHAADSDSTRALMDALHVRIGRCHRCRHFARPGLSDGYCAARSDLPHASGSCTSYRRTAGRHATTSRRKHEQETEWADDAQAQHPRRGAE